MSSPSLPTNALTTFEAVEGELGLRLGANRALLARMVGAVSDACENYCGRPFAKATVTSERVKGYGTQRLRLRRTPLLSITSVVLEGATIDSSGYYIEDADAGLLFRSAGWNWTAFELEAASAPLLAGTEEASFLVSYQGGYVLPWDTTGTRSLPYDVETACILGVVQLYRDRGKYASLETETEAQEAASWRGVALPKPARSMLNRYRRVG